MKALKIGQLAQASGVSIETIRYYERERLLTPAGRWESGYRQYDESAVRRLQFIRQSKEMGFSLGQVRELLRLWFDTESRCEHVRALASSKVAEIEDKLTVLQSMRRTLKKVLRECQERQSKEDCPLMQGLRGPVSRPGKVPKNALRKG